MSTSGLWLEDRQLSFRSKIPIPALQEGEALIKLRLAGICSTDLEMVKGYYPFQGVPGHEFVGEVVQSAGDESWVGKRVVGEINLSCGECAECKAGRTTHCLKRSVLGILGKNGVFADFFSLPVENLHPVPESVLDTQAVFTEPLAAALEIQQQITIQPSDRVLIVGAGRLGQLIARSLSLTGCELFVLVRREKQVHLLEGVRVQPIWQADLRAKSFDIVVEATGSPAGFEIARQAVHPRGTIVMKSTYAGTLDLNISALVVDEIRLVGSRCGPFKPALRLLEAGLVDPSPLIERVYSLEEGLQAFEFAASPGVFKVLLQPGD
jgi:threonine dehydrogenase-like Zn-dependent dehydrogenase